MSLQQVNQVKARLDSLASPSHESCGVFCSTCGGYARRLPPLLTSGDHDAIKAMLESSTLSELKQLGMWLEFLPVVQGAVFRRWIMQTLEELPGADVQAVDAFIFEARHWTSSPQLLAYSKLRELALQYVEQALLPENWSLLETILLTLKVEDIPTDLIDQAIEIAETDHQIARALYNRLREMDPRVRQFSSDLKS